MMKQGMKLNLKIAVLFALIFLVAGCGGDEEQAVVQEEKITSVKGMVLGAVDKNLTRNFTGTIEGHRQAAIYSKISETVDSVMVSEGDRVKADDLIIRLDKDGVESRYQQVYSVFVNAEKNYKKIKFLYDEGAVSESEYDAALTQYKVARADFEASAKLVELRSPISGLVTSVNVTAGDFAGVGMQVATIAQTDKLRMNLGVSDKDISYFNVGDKVTTQVESSKLLTASGIVSAVARSADPVTRTFQVEIEIDNSNGALLPGMFARAIIEVETFENIMVLPQNAAMVRGENIIVYVKNGDKVSARSVQLGAEFNGTVQILSGLNLGDTAIVVGQDYLDDGYSIKLVSYIDSDGKEIKE